MRQLLSTFFAFYLVIGFGVSFAAWVTDPTSDSSTLGFIPILAIAWPLWLFLISISG